MLGEGPHARKRASAVPRLGMIQHVRGSDRFRILRRAWRYAPSTTAQIPGSLSRFFRLWPTPSPSLQRRSPTRACRVSSGGSRFTAPKKRGYDGKRDWALGPGHVPTVWPRGRSRPLPLCAFLGRPEPSIRSARLAWRFYAAARAGWDPRLAMAAGDLGRVARVGVRRVQRSLRSRRWPRAPFGLCGSAGAGQGEGCCGAVAQALARDDGGRTGCSGGDRRGAAARWGGSRRRGAS